MPVSSPNPGDLLHSAFYRFAPVQDVPALIEALREATTELLGSILVAPEGINGMVAGSPVAVRTFEDWLRGQAGFEQIIFKRSECKTVPFGRMKVRRKAEIVPLGIGGVDVTAGMGVDVPPHEWRELIDQDDVVLLDNDMPGMRGLEVLEQMKRNPHTWGVPVISITGNATLNFATELQRLGGVGLVPKPFGMLELLCAVLTALKRPAAKNVSLPGLLAEYADRRLDAPPTGS